MSDASAGSTGGESLFSNQTDATNSTQRSSVADSTHADGDNVAADPADDLAAYFGLNQETEPEEDDGNPMASSGVLANESNNRGNGAGSTGTQGRST